MDFRRNFVFATTHRTHDGGDPLRPEANRYVPPCAPRVVPPAFPPEEVRRVARLARLDLTPAEEARLGVQMTAICDDFAGLADFAATLPPPPDEAPGPLREDAPRAPDDRAARVLATAPRVDAATGALRVPRGPDA